VRRGDLYRVAHPSQTEPKRSRVFAVVSLGPQKLAALHVALKIALDLLD